MRNWRPIVAYVAVTVVQTRIPRQPIVQEGAAAAYEEGDQRRGRLAGATRTVTLHQTCSTPQSQVVPY